MFYKDMCFCQMSLDAVGKSRCIVVHCPRYFPRDVKEDVFISVADFSYRCGQYRPESSVR